jgi:CubicO group peptidase (beta-lactamase class C family)
MGYGYQWWTFPEAGAYAALGLQGQFIYVVPKTKTVIVKLSYFPPGDMALTAEVAAFFDAVSAWNV